MLVSERMRREVVTIAEDDTLAEAARRLARRGIRHLPVCRDEWLVGIITDRDLRSAAPSSLVAPDAAVVMQELALTTVGSVMVREVVTVAPSVPLEEAARLMTTRRIGGLPVVEGGRLVGIITESDILRAFTELMGVLQPSSRLELEIANRPDALHEVLALLAQRHHLSIASALLLPRAGGAPQRLVLRLATMNLTPVLGTLREAGYRIIWPPREVAVP